MAWYSAHNIMVVNYLDETENPGASVEMVVLIEADEKRDDLTECARRESLKFESLPEFTFGGKKATLKYAGTRKIISCRGFDYEHLCGPEPPGDATEVCFSKYSVDSENEFLSLLSGVHPAEVTYANECARSLISENSLCE